MESDPNLMAQLRGLVVTDPDVSNEELVDWSEASGMDEQLTGGLGYVFVERVPAADLPAFAAARRTDPVAPVPAVRV